MSGISNYLEARLLGVTLCGSSFTAPATIYICLATSITSDGHSLTEVTTNVGYSRQPVTFQAPTNPGGTCASSINAAFGPATSGWGTVYWVCLVDSVTHSTGNPLYYGLLDTSRTVLTGDSITIPSSTLLVALA